MVELKTIRQTAALGLDSELGIRKRVKAGRCPGIQRGNRFLVNVQALAAMIEAESVEHLRPLQSNDGVSA